MYFAENMTPQPGKTYAINQKGSDLVVTVNGQTVAMRHWEGLEAQKWKCVEKDGWLGFVSRASAVNQDAYLGRDGNDSLVCLVSHHRDCEYSQVVLHDEGFAWEILNGDRLAFIGITVNGTGLKLLPKGTTWWGFTLIDGPTGSQPLGQPSHAPSTGTRSLSIDAPQMKLVVHW